MRALRCFLTLSLLFSQLIIASGQDFAREIVDHLALAQDHLVISSEHFSIDSSLLHYSFASKLWKKLDTKGRKKLSKQGIRESDFRSLKTEIRNTALSILEKEPTLDAYEQFRKKFPRLPGNKEEELSKKQNQLVLEALQDLDTHQEIKDLYYKYRSDFEYYSPRQKTVLDSTVTTNFFQIHDPANILHVLYFLKEYPDLGPSVDSILSLAVAEKPYIELVENYLRPYSTGVFPLTTEVIYQQYAESGDLSDLVQFGEKYPAFTQNEYFLRDFQVAKQSGYQIQSEFEDHLARYIKRAGGTHKAFVALQIMIAKDLENRDWAGAIEKIEHHRSHMDKKQKEIIALLEILKAPDTQIRPIPIDSVSINSALEEYSPVLTLDEETLYFCRRGGRSTKENIFVSYKTPKGWSVPNPVYGLNQKKQNEAPLAISADGTTILIFEEGVVKVSEKKARGWSSPEVFFPTELQSEWQGGTTLSADKKVVIFAARRPDRIGLPKEKNIDLYISFRSDSGEWSFPKNLGTTINTGFEERSPFLHPDMRTLYFSSAGRGGLGGLDVYKTTRMGDGWTEWSEPVNLGKDINTTEKDWGYRVSTKGEYAYYSAEVETRQEELYQVELPQRVRPGEVSTIKGELLDLEGKPIAGGELIIEDLENREAIAAINPDPATGKYFVPLPRGKLYSYTFLSDGFYPVSGHIDLRSIDEARHQLIDIEVPRISELAEKGIAITLNNLFFEHDQAKIRSASFQELDRLADFLIEHTAPVEISGHTDNVGSREYNLDLSQRRAQAVASYLVKRDVPKDKISAKAFGFSKPVASNETEEGRAQNRRVEIRFLK